MYQVNVPDALLMDQAGYLDAVIGQVAATGKLDFHIDKLLIVGVLGNAKPDRRGPRVVIDGVLFEGNRGEGTLSSETRWITAYVTFLAEGEP